MPSWSMAMVCLRGRSLVVERINSQYHGRGLVEREATGRAEGIISQNHCPGLLQEQNQRLITAI